MADSPGAPRSLPEGPHEQAGAAGPALPAGRRRRAGGLLAVLVALLLALLLLLALGLGGSAWLAWRHPAALPWLLQRLPGLQVQDVSGTLASGRLHIGRLDWQLPAGAGRLQVEGLQVDGASLVLWPRPGAQALLRLDSVTAARLHYTGGPPSGEPARAPTDLRLPIDLALPRLAVAQLQIDTLPLLHGVQAGVELGADGGRLHRITGLQLLLPAGQGPDGAAAPVRLGGDLQIGTAAPLPVSASLQASRSAAPAWQATLTARGPLATLQAEARLRGEPPAAAGSTAPSLQASATLLPFAAWPLGALQLQTEALDLSTLSPALPATRLAGRASVQTEGLDRPAALDLTLGNTLPGAWDAGRLPVRTLQLQASGRPDQPDRLALQRFELQLGDAAGAAGRITGTGQWQADQLTLALRTDGLQPARLHRSAAPLLLGGPLNLRISGLPAARPAGAAAGGSGAPAGPARPARPAQTTQAATGPSLALDGTLTGRWHDGTGPAVQLRLDAEASARHLLLRQADARAGDAQASLRGRLQAEGDGWRVQGEASLQAFDPRPWWRGPEGSAWRRGPHLLNAETSADVLWRPALGQRAGGLLTDRLLAAVDGQARLELQGSQLAGVPLAGRLALQSQGPTARLQAELVLAGNRVALDGVGGGAPAADRWQATLAAPTLAALAPLRPLLAELLPAAAPASLTAPATGDQAGALNAAWPRSGSLQASVQVQGRWPALRTEGTLRAAQLDSTLLQLQQASADWRLGSSRDSPLQLDLQAQGVRSAGQQIDTLALALSGTLASHRITLQADSPLRPPAWTDSLLGPAGTGSRLALQARGQWLPAGGTPGSTGPSQGGLLQGGVWQVQALDIDGGARHRSGAPAARPWLSAQGLQAALQIGRSGALQAWQLAPGRVQLPGTALNWRTLQWQAGKLDVAAELETIDMASLLARLQPEVGWRGDLTLGGRIDIRSSDRTLDADIVLARGGGDLSVTDDLGEAQPLGLTELRLALSAHDGRWQFAQGLAGRRIGSLAGAQLVQNPPGARWPQRGAPLQGLLEARVANLAVWGIWVPPGWRLSGAMDTVVQFGGALGAPQITGSMRGSRLGVRNVLEGVALTDGELALQFDGSQARIERLRFQGGEGSLAVTGGLALGAQPRLALQLVAERFRVLGRIDRRVVASGRADVVMADRRLSVDGDLRIDEGLIDIARGGAPTLDADVTVLRGGAAASAPPAPAAPGAPRNGAPADAPPPVQARLAVRVDLGPQLQLRGQGVEARLRGDVVVTSQGSDLRVNGTVSTVDGRYAAYGQKLEITRGRFVFTGEPGNPRLDVLAVRPNLDVLVGVLIDGTAQSPRIRLYSEPELADHDKLSWLVLGRSPDGLGSADTALLQRAAFALLAGDSPGPTDKLLQAIGLTDFSLRQTEGDARDTIISLGKQLSRRWYVGYERGVHATTGTWQLIYRVAQRFTLRAQSGEENALDLIWTWRW